METITKILDGCHIKQKWVYWHYMPTLKFICCDKSEKNIKLDMSKHIIKYNIKENALGALKLDSMQSNQTIKNKFGLAIIRDLNPI